MTAKIIFIWATLILSQSCATNQAFITKKQADGGIIGYNQPGIVTSEEDIARDFGKAAKKLCGKKKWTIVREIIPAPSSAFRAASKVSNKSDLYVEAGSDIEDTVYQVGKGMAGRRSPAAKTEFGSPLKSYNEAEIRCEKQ